VTLSRGETVQVRMTKWGDRPHWQFDCTYLGEDEHGEWLGIPRGTGMTRPGATYVSQLDQVGLVPPPSWSDGERGWLATFHASGAPLRVYVDVTAPPSWSGTTLYAADLDLDVVQRASGEVFVDDEDEFALHQVELAYPPEVVTAARASCERLVGLVSAGHPPYDEGTTRRWFDLLRRL
jgi:hypothetical protein